jgi:hypothetical protein
MSEEIYQAEDRASPLNQVHQKNIDKWLNGDEDFKIIIEYEISAIEKAEAKQKKEEHNCPNCVISLCLNKNCTHFQEGFDNVEHYKDATRKCACRCGKAFKNFRKLLDHILDERNKALNTKKEAVEMAKKFGINLDVYEPL